jgi:hypothetical protein
MSFTVQELENIANATLDHHLDRGTIYSQTIQDKPLLNMFDKKAKTFPAGKEFLTVRVKGEYTTTIQGFSHDDSVGYSNPANIKMATFPYKRIHAGIEVTFDELQRNGITINDSSNGRNESRHSDREVTALADLLDDKIEDMMEGRARGMNAMFWRDGTADSELVPGIKSFILANPTSATIVGGIDQSTNTWWRNRVSLNLSTASPQNSTIAQALQVEFRQLKRFGSPKHMLFAGSAFLDALEKELRFNGTYTDNGWAGKGSIDISIADTEFKGMVINYDPTLDDEGESKYLYIIDTAAIYPMYMDSERNKRHSPARPHDKYVMYRAITDVVGLVCRQRNTSGIVSIA